VGQLRRLVNIMEGSRRWSVESKEYEMLIKGGTLGVRIFERSRNKQRSIFVHRDEIVWLVRAVEVVVDGDTSEVFWDQSRAGCPRILTQKRSNRHGRFLIIEEYDGRRRSNSILIPEGRQGQGWTRLFEELCLASSSLRMEHGVREDKTAKVVFGRRSFAEVVRLSKSSEEDCLRARFGNGSKKASTKAQSLPEKAQVSENVGGVLGEMKGMVAAKQGAHLPANSVAGVACSGNKKDVKRQEEIAFNAKLELLSFRVWLRRVSNELAAGLEKVDELIINLEDAGPGRVFKASGLVLKSKKRKAFKGKKQAALKARVGLGVGPSAGKAQKEVIMTTGVGTSTGSGLVLPGHNGDSGPGSGLVLPEPNDRLGCVINVDSGPGSSEQQIPDGASFPAGSDGVESDSTTGRGNLRPHGKVKKTTSVCSAGKESGGSQSERVQIAPVGGIDSVGAASFKETAQAKGKREKHGGMSILNRPDRSWVAGKTGFGPVANGKVTDLLIPTEFLKAGEGDKASVSSPQFHILSVEVMGDEAIPEGVVEIDQLNLGRSKERNFSAGVELNVVDASPGFGVLDGGVSVAADNESRQGVAADSGQGAEPEPSVVTRKLDRSMEVSVIAGLSCDGQVGRQNRLSKADYCRKEWRRGR
jgi:hypothetical protein